MIRDSSSLAHHTAIASTATFALTRRRGITRHGQTNISITQEKLIDYGDRSLMKVQSEEETAPAMRLFKFEIRLKITDVWVLMFYTRMN